MTLLHSPRMSCYPRNSVWHLIKVNKTFLREEKIISLYWPSIGFHTYLMVHLGHVGCLCSHKSGKDFHFKGMEKIWARVHVWQWKNDSLLFKSGEILRSENAVIQILTHSSSITCLDIYIMAKSHVVPNNEILSETLHREAWKPCIMMTMILRVMFLFLSHGVLEEWVCKPWDDPRIESIKHWNLKFSGSSDFHTIACV